MGFYDLGCHLLMFVHPWSKTFNVNWCIPTEFHHSLYIFFPTKWQYKLRCYYKILLNYRIVLFDKWTIRIALSVSVDRLNLQFLVIYVSVIVHLLGSGPSVQHSYSNEQISVYINIVLECGWNYTCTSHFY